MNQIVSFEKLLFEGSAALRAVSPTPELDARLILQQAAQLAGSELIQKRNEEVSAEIKGRFLELISRRSKAEPVAYILGHKEFYGRNFVVSPKVLIPRPETELIVDLALSHIKNKAHENLTILDLGTGSGAIITTLACELKALGLNFNAVAIDNSRAALLVAKQNSSNLGVENLISFHEGSWFAPIVNSKNSFDLIVSNPPYIALDDENVSASISFEPKEALYSGLDGLDSLRAIFAEVLSYLKPTGLFICEIGSGQEQIVLDLASNIFGRDQSVSFLIEKDLAGLPRAFTLRKAES